MNLHIKHSPDGETVTVSWSDTFRTHDFRGQSDDDIMTTLVNGLLHAFQHQDLEATFTPPGQQLGRNDMLRIPHRLPARAT